MTIDSGGNVGIGTTSPAQEFSVAGDIYVTSTIAIGRSTVNDSNSKLTLQSASAGNFVAFEVMDSTGVRNFFISADGRFNFATLATADTSTHLCRNSGNSVAGCTADYPEWYPGDGILAPMDIAVISDVPNPVEDETAKYLMSRSSVPYESRILGVISDPVRGAAGGERKNETYLPLVLVGRVPVKVSTESGPIKIGDRITSSSIPGTGMKATTSGVTVGIALEGYDGTSASSTEALLPTGQTARTGKILVFVNLGYSKLDSEIAGGTIAGDAWSVDPATGRIKTTYSLDLSGQDIANVRAVLSANGTWGITPDGHLTAETVEARRGLTTYDTATGRPYCIQVTNGVTVTLPGRCVDLPLAGAPPAAEAAAGGTGAAGEPTATTMEPTAASGTTGSTLTASSTPLLPAPAEPAPEPAPGDITPASSGSTSEATTTPAV